MCFPSRLAVHSIFLFLRIRQHTQHPYYSFPPLIASSATRTQIARFPVASIVAAANNDTISPDAVSAHNYLARSDSGIQVFSDEQTILGVMHGSKNNAVAKENLVDKAQPVGLYCLSIDCVNTLILCEPTNTILAGDNDRGIGQVIHYSLSTHRAVKVYNSIWIGKVLSGIKVGHVCFFGGTKSTGIVDLRSKKVVPELFWCGPKQPISFAAMPAHKEAFGVVLVKAGVFYSGFGVSEDNTSFFDVTGLLKSRGSLRNVFELDQPTVSTSENYNLSESTVKLEKKNGNYLEK